MRYAGLDESSYLEGTLGVAPMNLLSIALLAVSIMPFNKLTEIAMARLIRIAYNSESVLGADRCRDLGSFLLDWNKSYIPAFTKRYIKEPRNEYERTHALAKPQKGTP